MIGYKFFKEADFIGGYDCHTKILSELVQTDWIEIKEGDGCSKFVLVLSHDFKRYKFKSLNCAFIQIGHRPIIQDFEIMEDDSVHYITHYKCNSSISNSLGSLAKDLNHIKSSKREK